MTRGIAITLGAIAIFAVGVVVGVLWEHSVPDLTRREGWIDVDVLSAGGSTVLMLSNNGRGLCWVELSPVNRSNLIRRLSERAL